MIKDLIVLKTNHADKRAEESNLVICVKSLKC